VVRAVAVQPASDSKMWTYTIKSAETATINQLSDTAHWQQWWRDSNHNKGAITEKI